MNDIDPAQVVANELPEILAFLEASPPFYELDRQSLALHASQLSIMYFPKGQVFTRDSHPQGLRILRSGAVEIRDGDGALLDKLGEGESFHIGGLNAERGNAEATVIEDSLIYFLADTTYREMRASNRSVDRYFSGQRSRRLRRAARFEPQPHSMLRELRSVMTRDILSVDVSDTVHATAIKMSERRVSSAFVTESQELVGLITDRDVRERVVASGLPLDTQVAEVMTPSPMSLLSSESIFSAMLLMTQHGFHHLPVLTDGKLDGVVTASDLMLAKQDDPIYLVQHLSRQTDVDGLCHILEGVPNIVVQWIRSGMRTELVSKILTAVSDALTKRLIELAEAEFGPAPAPYCWVAFGSQARSEQLLGADQDNGLIISGEESATHPWFKSLAAFVCDGLDACGYPYCPGDVMAKNPEWCQPLSEWLSYVDRWSRAPTADAVMRVSIFFDLRAVYGDVNLANDLQKHMLRVSAENSIFLAALAGSALTAAPPLGVFRRFVVDHDGEHAETMDIKKRGILLLTDVIRVHALANKIEAVNSYERLRALSDAKVFTIGEARDLEDALKLMQQLRVQHQVELVGRGMKSDNYLKPKGLSRLVREQLRDAFTIVKDAQAGVRQRYRYGMG